MKVALILAVLCALAFYGVSAQASSSSPSSSCNVQITWRARSDQYSSWYVGATHFQIYDVIVTNNGTCILTNIIGLFIAVGAGGYVSEGWNYNITSGIYSGYGGALQVGQSFYGAGFVLANSSSAMLSSTQLTCANSCSAGTTSAPSGTTSAPSGTTSAPSGTTSAPSGTTSAPSGTTSAPPVTTSKPSTTSSPTVTCVIWASVLRDSNWWMDSQGRNTSVYRLTITNNGPCPMQSFVLSFGWGNGVLISDWNLVSVQGGYQVTGFGPALAAGASFSAAGLILAGAPDNVSANPYSSSCASC